MIGVTLAGELITVLPPDDPIHFADLTSVAAATYEGAMTSEVALGHAPHAGRAFEDEGSPSSRIGREVTAEFDRHITVETAHRRHSRGEDRVYLRMRSGDRLGEEVKTTVVRAEMTVISKHVLLGNGAKRRRRPVLRHCWP